MNICVGLQTGGLFRTIINVVIIILSTGIQVYSVLVWHSGTVHVSLLVSLAYRYMLSSF
jgi:hypothetical protein